MGGLIYHIINRDASVNDDVSDNDFKYPPPPRLVRSGYNSAQINPSRYIDAHADSNFELRVRKELDLITKYNAKAIYIRDLPSVIGINYPDIPTTFGALISLMPYNSQNSFRKFWIWYNSEAAKNNMLPWMPSQRERQAVKTIISDNVCKSFQISLVVSIIFEYLYIENQASVFGFVFGTLTFELLDHYGDYKMAGRRFKWICQFNLYKHLRKRFNHLKPFQVRRLVLDVLPHDLAMRICNSSN